MFQAKKILNTVDAHVAGEPVRVIVSGLPLVRGKTMIEKKKFFEENLDEYRRLLVNEPRGHSDMYLSVFTPPVTEDGDFGLLFLHNSGLSTMCGHATIGSVSVAVETGIVKTNDGENKILVDTPAGRVKAFAAVENGKLVSVGFENVPAFVYKDNTPIPFRGSEIKVAIVFGGGFFIYVEEEKLGTKVCPQDIQEMISRSLEIKKWADENLEVIHPETASINGLYGVVVTSPLEKTIDGYMSRQTSIIDGGAVDRSPCGTGTSGRMALLHARGIFSLEDKLHSISIIDTEFEGSIIKTVNVKDIPAIIPMVKGAAYITGFHQFVLDPEDPLPHGFRL